MRFLTTARSEFEADAIRGGLSEAGIPVLAHGALQDEGQMLLTGRDIYVNDEDLERAKAVLDSGDEGFDEDELARLSDEAYREATEE
jgi:Putative prokaryotic signal transducing protein